VERTSINSLVVMGFLVKIGGEGVIITRRDGWVKRKV